VSKGRPVIFDMDMSPGDFVSLIYLLKAPREVIDLKVRKKTWTENLLKEHYSVRLNSTVPNIITLLAYNRGFWSMAMAGRISQALILFTTFYI
jgi:hypothetical protein